MSNLFAPGVMQGSLRVVENVGNVLGPLWVGFTVTRLYIMISLILILYLSSLVSTIKNKSVFVMTI